jgi:hypothetical protein
MRPNQYSSEKRRKELEKKKKKEEKKLRHAELKNRPEGESDGVEGQEGSDGEDGVEQGEAESQAPQDVDGEKQE